MGPRHVGRTLLCLLLLPVMAGCARGACPRDTPFDNTPCVRIALGGPVLEPDTIVLPRGQQVRLHVVNQGETPRALIATRFFATVATRPGDALLSVSGGVNVPAGASRDLTVVPLVAGRWRLEPGAPPGPFGEPGQIVVTLAPE
jgi:hypothetical protein